MRRLVPAPAEELPIGAGELDGLYGFPALPEGQAWIRGSFVTSLDGVAVGSDGRAGSIANDTDRAVFPVLRRTADVVLVGAGTVREERYRPSRRPMAIVSSSGDLPAGLPIVADRTPDDAPVYLMTTARVIASLPEHLREAIVAVDCGEAQVDLARVRQALIELGLPRIHCEGGMGLLSDLLGAGLVDEIVLTIVPVLLGGEQHLVAVPLPTPERLAFRQVLEHEGTLLLRADVLP